MPIRELSRRTGISPDLLRKWERRYGLLVPDRTPGGHRLYSRLDEARVRLMLDSVSTGMSPAQAAQQALSAQLRIRRRPSEAETSGLAASSREAIADALRRYDETRADAAFDAVANELSATGLVREILWPLASAGASGTGGQTSGASGVIGPWSERRLARLSAGWGGGLGPRAVIASGPLALTSCWTLAFGIALRGLGWRITHLGCDPALAALERAERALHPAALVIAGAGAGAATLPADLGVARERIALALPATPPAAEEQAALRLLDPDPVAAAEQLAV